MTNVYQFSKKAAQRAISPTTALAGALALTTALTSSDAQAAGVEPTLLDPNTAISTLIDGDIQFGVENDNLLSIMPVSDINQMGVFPPDYSSFSFPDFATPSMDIQGMFADINFDENQRLRQQAIDNHVTFKDPTPDNPRTTFIVRFGDLKNDGPAMSMHYMPTGDAGILSVEGKDPEIVVTTPIKPEDVSVTQIRGDDYARAGESVDLSRLDYSENMRNILGQTFGMATVGYPINVEQGATLTKITAEQTVSSDATASINTNVPDFFEWNAEERQTMHETFMQGGEAKLSAVSQFWRNLVSPVRPNDYANSYNAAVAALADPATKLPQIDNDAWFTGSYDHLDTPFTVSEEFAQNCDLESKYGDNFVLVPARIGNAYGHIPTGPDTIVALDADDRTQRLGVFAQGSFSYNFETGAYTFSESVLGTAPGDPVDGCTGTLTGYPYIPFMPGAPQPPTQTGTPPPGPEGKPPGGGYEPPETGIPPIIVITRTPDTPITEIVTPPVATVPIPPAALGLLTGLLALGGISARRRKEQPKTPANSNAQGLHVSAFDSILKHDRG